MEIVTYIPNGKQGFPSVVPLVEIVNSILYKLKTGIQWKYLSVRNLLSDKGLTWQNAYSHFKNWKKLGAFKQCWFRWKSYSFDTQRRISRLSR